MSRKKWTIRTADSAVAQTLADEFSLPLPIAQVLALRGNTTVASAETYLSPKLSDLADPFQLPDMAKAVARIWKAIDHGETITVFGDYDADGVTASALTIRILSTLGAKVSGFVPDRLDEGYGLSSDALERCLAEQKPRLVISVDCGTNSVESVALAQKQEVDVVVTDHHEPDEQTAPAFALINPKLGSSCDYLSGVGVAFKLAHALVKAGREHGKPSAMHVDLRHYLDIVALGTVSDIVPLVEENRIMVRFGLIQLVSTRWVGLDALMDVASIRGDLNTGHLGFQLGPRINAAGRIGEPMQALRLLTTDDPLEARNIAKLLDRKNRERRDIERKIADDALAEIDSYFNPERHFGLAVAREGWHPGVVGIVASRVARSYNRPAIIMGVDEDGSARGSCRGIELFDMLAGLQACASHLTKFGGHRMAAGLEVRPGALEAFKEAFNAVATEMLADADLSPIQPVDAVVASNELNGEFYETLKRLHPFGQDNPEPIWALRGGRVAGAPRQVGQRHLKFVLENDGHTFDAIAFNYPAEALPAGAIDVAFTLNENNWNGSNSLQLQVQDIRPAE